MLRVSALLTFKSSSVIRKSGTYTRQYWPPSESSRIIALPGGRKKMFVFNGKNDRDGNHSPVLCIATRGDERLAFFDEEEVAELERIIERVEDYMSLWERKASRNRELVEVENFTKQSANDSIGVEL